MAGNTKSMMVAPSLGPPHPPIFSLIKVSCGRSLVPRHVGFVSGGLRVRRSCRIEPGTKRSCLSVRTGSCKSGHEHRYKDDGFPHFRFHRDHLLLETHKVRNLGPTIAIESPAHYSNSIMYLGLFEIWGKGSDRSMLETLEQPYVQAEEASGQT